MKQILRSVIFMLISKQNPLNTDYLLYDFEKQFHFELPNRYKLFLIKYNGGDTPETKFKSGKVSSDVRFFYGLGDVEYDLMKIIDLLHFRTFRNLLILDFLILFLMF